MIYPRNDDNYTRNSGKVVTSIMKKTGNNKSNLGVADLLNEIPEEPLNQ